MFKLEIGLAAVIIAVLEVLYVLYFRKKKDIGFLTVILACATTTAGLGAYLISTDA